MAAGVLQHRGIHLPPAAAAAAMACSSIMVVSSSLMLRRFRPKGLAVAKPPGRRQEIEKHPLTMESP